MLKVPPEENPPKYNICSYDEDFSFLGNGVYFYLLYIRFLVFFCLIIIGINAAAEIFIFRQYNRELTDYCKDFEKISVVPSTNNFTNSTNSTISTNLANSTNRNKAVNRGNDENAGNTMITNNDINSQKLNNKEIEKISINISDTINITYPKVSYLIQNSIDTCIKFKMAENNWIYSMNFENIGKIIII